MLVITALAGVSLVVARSARVEVMTSTNAVAGARASAVERAAEQYVLALVASQRETVMTLDERAFNAVPVGTTGVFWIVRPDYGDASLPAYGLVDEASKLHLNTATRDMLHRLASMPDVLPDSMFDWRDDDDNLEGDGAEREYYNSLRPPYDPKNAAFEAVEELLLVRGAYPELLFGNGPPGGMLAANAGGGLAGGGMRMGELGESEMLARGLIQYLTVYSREPGGNNGRTGRINVNTACREVLACLTGLSGSELDSLVTKRTFGSSDTQWFTAQAQQPITGQSYQFSADIVAASGDGRAFRRVRIVVDAFNAEQPPKLVYRHDLTDLGWPLDPEMLASMRTGGGSGNSQYTRAQRGYRT
jgi:type II secretory pathway component PulK